MKEQPKRYGLNASFDGMCWPVVTQELNDLEWRLRYAANGKDSDRLTAAGVISAYRALIWMPRRTLLKRVAQLRRMAKLPDSLPAKRKDVGP